MNDQIEVEDGRKPRVIYVDIELDDAGLSLAEFRLYTHIARRCLGRRGQMFEGMDSAARHCRMNRDTAWEAIKELVRRNMLRCTKNPGRPNTYTLTDKSEWWMHSPEDVGKEGSPPISDTTHPLFPTPPVGKEGPRRRGTKEEERRTPPIPRKRGPSAGSEPAADLAPWEREERPRRQKEGRPPETEIEKRLCAIYRRRPNTPMAEKERKALQTAGVHPDDLALVETHYAAEMKKQAAGQEAYHRRDLFTLLNNWPSAVDRARAFAARRGGDAGGREYLNGIDGTTRRFSQPPGGNWSPL